MRHSPYRIAKKTTCLSFLLCISLFIAACVMDAVHPAVSICPQLGGQIEYRPHPTVADATTGYCRFNDDTECDLQQLQDGTCSVPEMSASVSPLKLPENQGASASVSVVPLSLEALMEIAPLILIGEVGPVVQYLDFAVYGDDGQLLERGSDPSGALLPEVPATDFSIIVENVIRDDGTVAKGEAVILRMPGTVTVETKLLTQLSGYPFSYTGDRHLFLFTPNPDGKSYGFYFGPWSRLIVDGDILRVSNGEQTPLQLADTPAPMTLEEFIQYVQSQ